MLTFYAFMYQGISPFMDQLPSYFLTNQIYFSLISLSLQYGTDNSWRGPEQYFLCFKEVVTLPPPKFVLKFAITLQ